MTAPATRDGRRDHRIGARAVSELAVAGAEGPQRLFWGDLHNHNAVGYAKGSLQRSIDLAREHLDFFAFTGHAHWHDITPMPGDRHMKWVRGFEVHTQHWPKTKRMIHAANTEEFVAFLGYEWHSSRFGDRCVIYPDDGDLYLPNHIDPLLEHAHHHGAWAIPHHVGYKPGWRGANWDYYRHETAPVVEIFSEHGCCVTDRSPFPMIRHSNGGRATANMITAQLKRGLRFGFVASSDDHRGYPGAYGEGVVGIWAEELTRASLFEAIHARRTFAATGDRIALEVTLNDHPMGSEIDFTTDRQIDVRVVGQDSLASVELIRNGRVIQRHFPEDQVTEPVKLPGRAKCRLHYGWGPWAALNLGRVCDWDMTVSIEGGRLVSALPCFQAAPFDEKRRDRLRIISDNKVHLQSPTTRVSAYGEDPTKSLILELEGRPDSVLTVELTSPAKQTIRTTLAGLVENDLVEFTGGFTSESLILGRLIAPSEYATRVRWTDRQSKESGSGDWYYVRVTQHNGQMAWSSPIWVG